MSIICKTANGAVSHTKPTSESDEKYNARLSLFFKGVRGLSTDNLRKLLAQSRTESIIDTFVLAFHLRDCRGGKGERELGRQALVYLSLDCPDDFSKVMDYMAEYGRWDDLLYFFPNVLENEAKKLEVGYYNFGISKKAVNLFAKQLEKDRENMLENKPVSVCAKWAPTENDSLDRKFFTYKSLYEAMKIKPSILRKKYLTPLRKYLRILENSLSRKDYTFDYSKIPSQAVKRYRKTFVKNDSERYTKWLESVKKGEMKVNAKQLHPHEIVKDYLNKDKKDDLLEEQWKVLEANLKHDFSDTVCIVDVSGSMSCNDNNPLSSAIALGILISSRVSGIFRNHVITFSDEPSFFMIDEKQTLFEKVQNIKEMDWGGSTNLLAVFELILQAAKANNLSTNEMPKRLIIFSDMQFNQADRHYSTNMDRIEEMYSEAGYERPSIVFWNMNGQYDDYPADTSYRNIALVSGFSPSMVSCLLNKEELTPVTILNEILHSERYSIIRKILEN